MLKSYLIDPFYNLNEIYVHMKSMINFIINNYAADSVDMLISKISLFQDYKEILHNYLTFVQEHLDNTYSKISIVDELEIMSKRSSL